MQQRGTLGILRKTEWIVTLCCCYFCLQVMSVCVCVFICVRVWVGDCVCQRTCYKGIRPRGVDASLQCCRGGEGGGEQVQSRCGKQPYSSVRTPRSYQRYLFEFFFSERGPNLCSVAFGISDRKDQAATPQMKLSKWPDSWVPRRTSLACTFYFDRGETSQQEGKTSG